MPRFESVQVLPRPVAEVFDFFTRPANLLHVSPPELHLEIAEAPARLALGSRLVLKGRRWGMPQRVVSEVTVFEPDRLVTDEQREGPFRRWVHTHHFEPADGDTKVTDIIDFEPPGGLLGLLANAAFIQRDLEGLFAYRRVRLEELLGRPR